MEKTNVIFKKEYFSHGSYPYEVVRSCIPGYEEIKHIVIIIPGNPGVAEFYHKFMEALQCNLGKNYSVWCLTYGIYCEADYKYETPNLLNHEIEHKIRFFKYHVPKNVQISLVCHSIGCYLALSLLNHFKRLEHSSNEDQNDEKLVSDEKSLYGEIDKCYMLFPTIERMEESPNGQRYTFIIKYCIPLVTAASSILGCIPVFLKKFVAKLCISRYSDPVIDVVANRFGGKFASGLLNFAKYEFKQVVEADFDSINNVKDKLKFYYSPRDSWAPLSYMEDLLKKIPDLDCKVENMPHAFISTRSSEMANILARNIQN